MGGAGEGGGAARAGGPRRAFFLAAPFPLVAFATGNVGGGLDALVASKQVSRVHRD